MKRILYVAEFAPSVSPKARVSHQGLIERDDSTPDVLNARIFRVGGGDDLWRGADKYSRAGFRLLSQRILQQGGLLNLGYQGGRATLYASDLLKPEPKIGANMPPLMPVSIATKPMRLAS